MYFWLVYFHGRHPLGKSRRELLAERFRLSTATREFLLPSRATGVDATQP